MTVELEALVHRNRVRFGGILRVTLSGTRAVPKASSLARTMVAELVYLG